MCSRLCMAKEQLLYVFETESAGAFCGQGGVLPFVVCAAVDRTDIGIDPESPASAVIRIC